MSTKLEIATQILAAMAPAIAADVIAESKRTASSEQNVSRIARKLLEEIENGASRSPHVLAVIAFKLASDLVDLTIKADAGEASKK